MPALPAARLSPFVTERELPFWQDILPLGERRFWHVHMPVFCPGEKSGGMHLVLSGSFRAVAFSRSGQQRTLWIMRAHSLIGEVSLLTDSAAIYLMECEDEGETVFFPARPCGKRFFPPIPKWDSASCAFWRSSCASRVRIRKRGTSCPPEKGWGTFCCTEAAKQVALCAYHTLNWRNFWDCTGSP